MSQNKRQKRGDQNARPTIGLFTALFSDPDTAILWAGVDDAARELGANALCFPGGELNEPQGPFTGANVLYELASTENLDGLVIWGALLASSVGPEAVSALCEQYRPLPMINVGLLLEGIPSVLLDNYQGVRDAIIHLIEVHDYRRIAFIRGPQANPEAEERYRAYTDTLAEYSIPLDPDLVAPGNFTRDSGAEAVRLLLDERQLRLQKNFEAIMGADDIMIFGALEELQARGVRVPNDVAVIGFDDAPRAKTVTPPLTTVRAPFYEQGWQAVEMLLAQLRGEKVPEQVTVPLEVVVRRSCGCLDPAVVQAAAGYIAPSVTETFEAAFAAQRDDILSEMTQAVGETAAVSGWVEQLLDAFSVELMGDAPAAFSSTLEEILRQAIAAGDSVMAWQDALSVLRRHVLPCLGDDGTLSLAETLSRIEGLLGQARILIGDAARRVQAHWNWLAEQRTATLHAIGQSLITTFDVNEVTDFLVQALPQLGIPACYLSLYEDPEAPAESSRLILSFDERGRVELEAGGRRFPSYQLAPDGLLPPDRRYSMVIEPLFFQEDQMGFVLFEASPGPGMIYYVLGGQISSALRGALLMREHERAQAETDKRVRELNCLNDIGRRLAESPPVDELLPWVAARVPPAMQYPLHCVVAIEYQGQVYGVPEAKDLPRQMVQSLRAGNAFGGRIYLSYTQAHEFLDEESALLGDIARRVNSYLENQLLFEQTQQQLADLAAIQETVSKLTAAITFDEAIAALLPQLAAVTQAETVNMFLVEGEHMVCVGVHSTAGRSDLTVGEVNPLDEFPLTKEVLETRQPMALMADDPRLQPHAREAYAAAAVAASATIPLVGREGVLGFLILHRHQAGRGFTEHEISLLQTLADQATITFEKSRLFQEANSRAERLTVVNRIAKAAGAALEPDDLMEAVHQEIATIFQPDAFFLALYGEETDELDFRFMVEEGTHTSPGRVPLGGLTSHVVAEKKPLVIRDLEQARQDLPAPVLVGAGDLAASWMGVPMLIGERLIGVINVQSRRPNIWDKEDEQLLITIADQVAVAMDSARLFEETRIHSEELAVLNELGQALTARLSVGEVLSEAYQQASRLVDTTNFYIGLYDPDKNEISFAFDVTESEIDKQITVISADQGLAGYIIHHRTSVLLKDNVRQRQEALGIEMVGEESLSWLGVPLIVGDRVLGAMAVHSFTTPGLYDEHDRDLLTAIASQAAIALQNARLFEQTQTRAEEMAILNEMSRELSSMRQVVAVIESAHRHASRLIDTTNFYVALYYAERDEVSFPYYAEGEQVRRAGRRRTGKGMTEYVLQTQEPLLIKEEVSAWFAEQGVEQIGQSSESWLGVPLMVGGQVIGVVAVQSYTTPRLYDEHDRDLLSTIANQVAIALQSARLFEQTQDRAGELAVLNEMGRTLSEILDVGSVVENLYQYTSHLIDTTNFYVALYDARTDEVSFPLAFEHGERREWGSRRAGKGLTEHLLRSREPLLVEENVAARLGELGIDMIGQEALSWLGVPMMRGNQVLGVVAAQSYTVPRLYTEHHRDLLISIANQAAIAIENARLLEQAQSRAERERLVRTITDRIRRGTDTEAIVRVALEELSQTFGTSELFVRLGSRAQISPEPSPQQVRPGHSRKAQGV